MRALVERKGNRIHLRTEEHVRKLWEHVPGANFSERARAWTFPLSMDVCRNLRQHFGAGLRIGPALTEWARAEVARETSLGKLGRTLEAVPLPRIEAEYPALAKALAGRSYQAAAARFAAEGVYTLNGDTPGLGKTTETIAAVIESGVPGPYLVCAPKTSLDVVWERELAQRLPDAIVRVISGSAAVRAGRLESALLDAEISPEYAAKTWIITNIEMMRTKSWWRCPECGQEWPATDHPKSSIVDCGHDSRRVKTIDEHKYPQLFKVEWGAIIMDECQRALIRNSGTPTLTRAGAMRLRVRDDGLRMALSGTPMRGKPQRLFGTLQWLRPKVYTGYWSWVERYWHVTQEGYAGARTIGGFRYDREDAFNRALDGIMIRRTKEEVAPELPRKAYMGGPLDPRDLDSPVGVWLPMGPQQAKAYQQMLASGSADVNGGQVNAVGILAEMTRLKQFASVYGGMEMQTRVIDCVERKFPIFTPQLPSNKFDWLVQFLTERNIIDPDDEPTGKVVIVSQFTEILDLFREALRKLDVESVALTGKVTGGRRAEAIDIFNDMRSGVNVMFLNTTAGGVAVTLDAADDMVFLDETHIPDDQEQAEERINNRRAEEKVVTRRYWYLKSLGTIDEAIARVNADRDKQQKHHLDGRRGIAYFKEVYKTLEEVTRK